MNGHEQLSLDAPAEAAAPPEGMEIRVRANGSGGRPGPTLEQAEAIGNRDRDVFLEAGAGTGKTRVLVERYCDAIAVDGVEPERILAFTFTEKAAAEMRRRVRVELSRRAAAAAEQSERARLQAAARTGEAAPITTIHGFCRRLLASHPVAAGLDPRFRVLDADEAGRLARTCFDEVLTELAGDDDAVALTAAGYRSRLGSIVLAAHSELRNRGILDPELPEIAISAIDGRDEPATPAEIAAVGGGYAALRKLVVAFSARFDERKAERSAVDFDDLQLLAVDLLRRNRRSRRPSEPASTTCSSTSSRTRARSRSSSCGCSRGRRRARSPSATPPSRSTASAAPTSPASAAFATSWRPAPGRARRRCSG